MTPEVLVAVALAVLVIGVIITVYVLAGVPSKRERIRREQLEAEARITGVTYTALQRLFEEARRSPEGWNHDPGRHRP